MINFTKKFIIDIYNCKKEFLFIWIFFFVVSLTGQSPYSVIKQLLISGIFSLTILILSIIYLKLFRKYYLKIK